MHEAIELIEKQLQEVRNKIGGTRDRKAKRAEQENSDDEILDTLKMQELRLQAAVTKLRN